MGIPAILDQFLFPRQVASRLYAVGWRRKDMPTKIMFRDLCGALRASGYDADAAANLWNKCLHYDREAIEQLRRDTSLYGVLHLSQFFDPMNEEELTEQRPSSKRKRAAKPRRPKSNR
jgi:hypothetical protein